MQKEGHQCTNGYLVARREDSGRGGEQNSVFLQQATVPVPSLFMWQFLTNGMRGETMPVTFSPAF